VRPKAIHKSFLGNSEAITSNRPDDSCDALLVIAVCHIHSQIVIAGKAPSMADIVTVLVGSIRILLGNERFSTKALFSPLTQSIALRQEAFFPAAQWHTRRRSQSSSGRRNPF
jgi:hypothetical protein